MDKESYQNRMFQKGHDKYRQDNRTREKFEEDIQKFTEREFEIIKQFVGLIESETGINFSFQDNEGDRGQVIDVDETDNNPDFTLNLNLEVKECQPKNNTFHLKTKQVKEYKEKENCKILFILGSDTEKPEFTTIHPEEALEKGKRVKWFGGKDSIRLHIKDFTFRDLDTGEEVERFQECENEECDETVRSGYCSFDCMGDSQ